MKKNFNTLLFVLFFNVCFGQFTGNPYSINSIITYRVKLILGNENILKNADDMMIEYNYDSVGYVHGCYKESEYVRFKMLHYYTNENSKHGDDFKERYYNGKSLVSKEFHVKLNEYCKDSKLHFSTYSPDSKYTLIIYFEDTSEDPLFTIWEAKVQIVDSESAEVLLEYYINVSEVDKNEKDDPTIHYYKIDRYSHNDQKPLLEFSFILGKLFREKL